MHGDEARSRGAEADDIAAVVRSSLDLLDDSTRPVRRGQHPKMHGLVRAEFVVESQLSDEYRVGLFAEPGRSYPAWIRFSNGSKADDRRPDAHGMAIKLVGVEGTKLLEDRPDALTHDFVLVDHPSFFIRNPAEYAALSRAMVRASGKGEVSRVRQALWFRADPARMLLTLIVGHFFPRRLGTLARMLAFAGSRPDSPLTARYWSTTPYRFGPDRAVKYTVRPEAANLAPRSAAASPRSADFLRRAMVAELDQRDVVFAFQVQFARDDRATPIEDPTVEWAEAAAPAVTLARIKIPRQHFDEPAQRIFGEQLSFTPWHALPEHEPLGGINRTRREVYRALAQRRRQDNGAAQEEPKPSDRPGHPVPVARDPSGFGQVLEVELEQVHARRRAVFPAAPVAPAPRFASQHDEDRRIAVARGEALGMHVSGLAFSGGGIRSGTFAAGFLQGLASVGVLKRFDYLSTVSGGGYAGGWLAGWIRRARSVAEVERQLADDRRSQGGVDRVDIRRQVVDEEPEPLRHLRAYSSYLFPQPGMLKPDTWTVLLIWARNVMINLGMLLPMALGVVAAARLVIFLFGQTNQGWIDRDGPAGAWGWIVAVGYLGVTLACGLLGVSRGIRALDEFRFRNPAYRPEGITAWGILAPAMVAAALTTVFVRWVLWQLGAYFDGMAARPPALAITSRPVRFAWDYLVTHLDLLDPPNIALHVATIGGFMAILAARAAGRNAREFEDQAAVDRRATRLPRRESVARAGQVGTFARAAFLAAGSMAILVVLLEVLIRQLGVLGRPDLMAMTAPPLSFLIFVVGMTVQVALLGYAIEEAEREWWARLSALLTLAAIAWAGTVGAIVYLPGLIYAGGGSARTALASGWLGTAVVAVVSGRYVLPNLRNRLGGLSVTFLASLASVLFLGGFVGLVGLLGAVLINTPALLETRAAGVGTYGYYQLGVVGANLRPIVLVLLGSVLLYALAIRVINVNLFSLHAMYTDRLVRCYLGASRPLVEWAGRWTPPRDRRVPAGAPSLGPEAAGLAANRPRNPNPTTGFDPGDDLPLYDLRIGPRDPADPHARPFDGPHLLINATLNLVEGHNLAWRDRKGESFTLSPLFCGSKGVGYARLDAHSRRNLTLGGAMAISGAAVDPNMSYFQSPPLTALLTIFNARLGYWIARPRPSGWAAAGPKFGDLLLTEFLGRTDGSRDFVHLSDGGHFENLGVYELVRRRCRYVLAVDAGSDGEAADDNLADLVRLCRVDFGVAIDLDTTPIRVEGPGGLARSHVAVGKIRYGAVDADGPDGLLVYVKISLTGDEPSDVLQYARANPPFPHQATDYRQAFDEAQFESYRCLGNHIALKVFESLPACQLGDVVQPSEDYAEKVFDALRDRWSAGSSVAARAPDRAVAEWSAIQRTLLDDPRLAPLVHDLFPEVPAAAVDGDGGHARAELQMVDRMLHVMQDLWRELGLDRDSTLPVNQGWMNTFRRWTGTEAARRLWPTVSTGLAPGFVRFCCDRLGLDDCPARLVPLADLTGGQGGDPFQVEALDRIAREFDRDWPGPGGEAHLRALIRGAAHVGLDSPTAWLLVRGADDAVGRVACGVLVMGRDGGEAAPDSRARVRPRARPAAASPEAPAGPDDGRGIEFLAWLRRPFRSAEGARPAIRDAIRATRRALLDLGRDPTLHATFPITDGDDARLVDWLAFHEGLNFRRARDAAGSTVVRLAATGPATLNLHPNPNPTDPVPAGHDGRTS